MFLRRDIRGKTLKQSLFVSKAADTSASKDDADSVKELKIVSNSLDHDFVQDAMNAETNWCFVTLSCINNENNFCQHERFCRASGIPSFNMLLIHCSVVFSNFTTHSIQCMLLFRIFLQHCCTVLVIFFATNLVKQIALGTRNVGKSTLIIQYAKNYDPNLILSTFVSLLFCHLLWKL